VGTCRKTLRRGNNCSTPYTGRNWYFQRQDRKNVTISTSMILTRQHNFLEQQLVLSKRKGQNAQVFQSRVRTKRDFTWDRRGKRGARSGSRPARSIMSGARFPCLLHLSALVTFILAVAHARTTMSKTMQIMLHCRCNEHVLNLVRWSTGVGRTTNGAHSDSG
jgi:hypothetical protein